MRDTKTQEGHKETGGTQRHKRDTKTQEGEITHRHFRRIKVELTDQKDFIRGDHLMPNRQEILKTSKTFLYHGATDISDVVLLC